MRCAAGCDELPGRRRTIGLGAATIGLGVALAYVQATAVHDTAVPWFIVNALPA